MTLEPCCHYGKQPPCVDAILDAGIHRVVVGSADPNPLVAGKGIAILRAHGIDVTENVLQEECDALNKVFFHYITTKRPFVSMKYAMTMDGKIATYRRFQMDHRGNCPESCSTAATPIPRHYGGSRNHPGR